MTDWIVAYPETNRLVYRDWCWESPSFFFLLTKNSINNSFWGILRQLQTWWLQVSFSYVEKFFWAREKVEKKGLKSPNRCGFHYVSVTPNHQSSGVFLHCERRFASESLSILGFIVRSLCLKELLAHFALHSPGCVHRGQGHVLFPSWGYSLWFWEVK